MKRHRLSWPTQTSKGLTSYISQRNKLKENIKPQDLAIADKKRKEIEEWFRSHYEAEPPQSSNASKILVVTGPVGCGKSTAIKVLCDSFNLRILECDTNSSLSDFDEFLNSCSNLSHSLSCISNDNNNNNNNNNNNDNIYNSVVVIEELPYLHSSEQETTFRATFARYIQYTLLPTIILHTDTNDALNHEDDDFSKTHSNNLQLTKWVEASILHSQLCYVVKLNPVTKAKMKNCLKLLFKNTHIINNSQALDELHMSSKGDLRAVIQQVQILIKNNSYHSKRSKLTVSDSLPDMRLTLFHALGKLLYAKRIATKENNNDSNIIKLQHKRPRLEFDPETVMNQSTLTYESAIEYLTAQAPHFFQDVEELSESCTTFSDAMSLTSSFDTRDKIFPSQYLCSLGSRAIADAKWTPTVNGNMFRSFSAPKTFTLHRQRNENNQVLKDLQQHLFHCIELPFTSLRPFVLHEFTYVSLIQPGVQDIMSNMHSATSDNSNSNNNNSFKNFLTKNDNCYTLTEQQQQILQEDDIAEFDSD